MFEIKKINNLCLLKMRINCCTNAIFSCLRTYIDGFPFFLYPIHSSILAKSSLSTASQLPNVKVTTSFLIANITLRSQMNYHIKYSRSNLVPIEMGFQDLCIAYYYKICCLFSISIRNIK